ncbi:carbohydrate ABC transporter permease [Desulfurobacterium atlanticum]|uniref:sn-glycerol-3-phosphate transport system permease protein UgpE n=1 Tax=Desulfurobacterium atlanticum TaxID=240169 RepID=A0A238Y6T3_9BACT|nr:carbohydrate ABC transporter permease [Desulfurobacterium atlanticum]SNR66662.1 carbohydrate ABC transporter membrane protein 2, CUT1 family [Desulfurobacterium atlanticum]
MKGKSLKLITYTLLIISILIIALPVITAFIFSTQTPAEIFSYPPKFTIGKALISNYKTAWSMYHLGKYMLNTFFIAIAVTAGKIVISFLAATVLVYFDIPFKRALFIFILLTLMMPTEIMIVALFDIVTKLGWSNSYLALTIPFLASATGTFLFRQHFLQISPAIVDAAKVEGAGPLQFAVKILFPMSANVIAALTVIEFVYVWNQYLWPLVIIRDNSKQMIQIGLRMMITGQDATNWGIVMAGAVISLLPALAVFLFLQRYLTKGLFLGSEK